AATAILCLARTSRLIPLYLFLCHFSGHHPDLLSFPTRRSSDLPRADGGIPRRRILTRPLPRLSVRGPLPLRVGARTESRGSGRRSEEHTSELQSLAYLVCRLLLEKKKALDILTNCPCISARWPI